MLAMDIGVQEGGSSFAQILGSVWQAWWTLGLHRHSSRIDSSPRSGIRQMRVALGDFHLGVPQMAEA